MIREFIQLVDEAVDEGFDRGLNLFMESLEEDLVKSEIITESGGFDKVVSQMMTADGIELLNEEEISEERIDALLKELEKGEK